MIRILIVGAGGMANTHAAAFAAMDGVACVGVVEPVAARRTDFCARHGIEMAFGDLEAALDWGEFDAAANVTPDQVHKATTLPLLSAGKHVLCEKPLATCHADAVAMRDAADAAGVVAMINLTYRNVPALARAREMIAEGRIGKVRHVEASYLQSWLAQHAWGDWRAEDQWLWRLSKAHGSAGVLGDVGVHILDFLTHATGEAVTDMSCRLATFDKAPGGRIGEYVLDANDSCAMTVRLSGGALGVVHASRFATGHVNDLRLRVHGTEGALDVQSVDGESRLRACLGHDLPHARWRHVRTQPAPSTFQRFVAAIRGDAAPDPDFATGATLQRLLDLGVGSDARSGQMLAV